MFPFKKSAHLPAARGCDEGRREGRGARLGREALREHRVAPALHDLREQVRAPLRLPDGGLRERDRGLGHGRGGGLEGKREGVRVRDNRPVMKAILRRACESHLYRKIVGARSRPRFLARVRCLFLPVLFCFAGRDTTPRRTGFQIFRTRLHAYSRVYRSR